MSVSSEKIHMSQWSQSFWSIPWLSSLRTSSESTWRAWSWLNCETSCLLTKFARLTGTSAIVRLQALSQMKVVSTLSAVYSAMDSWPQKQSSRATSVLSTLRSSIYSWLNWRMRSLPRWNIPSMAVSWKPESKMRLCSSARTTQALNYQPTSKSKAMLLFSLDLGFFAKGPNV